MQWYFQVFKRYFDFRGRSRRKEFWPFNIVNNVIIAVFYNLGDKAGVFTDDPSQQDALMLIFWTPLIIYFLLTFIPWSASVVRRLHDTGRSGWLYFLCFIPIVNFVLVILLLQDSNPGPNKYGPNPKLPAELALVTG